MIENLQEHLGLTKNEARVYQALIQGVEMDPVTIAKETNLPRTRVYGMLSNLAAKNFLERRKDGNGYRLIPPSESIPEFMNEIEKEHHKRKAKVDEFGKYLQNVWNNGLASHMSPGVEIISLVDAETVFLEQLKQVKNRLWIAAADKSASIDMKKSARSLAIAMQKNQDMDIRYLVSNPAIMKTIKMGMEQFVGKVSNIQFKSSEDLHSSFVILDDIIYIFFFSGQDVLEASAMRTSSLQLVKTFEWTYDKLWEEV